MGWLHNGTTALDELSQYKRIVSVALCMTVFMLIIVLMRAYVRIVMIRAVGLDDYIIFFGALCSLVYTGLCIGQTRWGLGLRPPKRPKENLNMFTTLNYSGRPIYTIGVLAFKVALCLSYLRIVSQANPKYRMVVWAVLITCVMGHIGSCFVLIFQCKPVQKNWRPLTPGSCIPNDSSFYALAAVSILYDLIIMFLPIPLLLKLQVARRKKIALIGVFALGMFTTFCSFMRMSTIAGIMKTGDSSDLVMWATIELNVGLALTCIPTLVPLFKFFRESKSQGYNLDDTPGGHSRSNPLRYLKSQQQTTITTSNKDIDGQWKDSDSVDNSSQKKILGLQSSLAEFGKANHGPHENSSGITTTTVIAVEHSDATREDMERSGSYPAPKVKTQASAW